MNTDEDSNMSQVGRDFFMQTHGDKAGSFDLLQRDHEIIEETEYDENTQNDLQNKSFRSSELFEKLIFHETKRLNTDNELIRKHIRKFGNE